MSSKSLLITAFEPFGAWQTNSSALCLQQLLGQLPPAFEVSTRIYPVDFNEVHHRLAEDLEDGFDFAIHLGQAHQTGRIRLESIAINVGALPDQSPGDVRALLPGGPVAYQTDLPLTAWASQLLQAGIPAYVSYHAGTFLCNATFYWSQLFIAERGLPTRSCFVHLPLDVSQMVGQSADWPTLPAETSASAVRFLAGALARL